MSNLRILKKIAIASVNSIRQGFKVESDKDGFKDFAPFLAMRVVGIAREYENKTSETMGISQQFKGEFRAFNKDGQEFASPVCYLPEPAQGLLKGALDGADGGAVEFGFDIMVHPNKTAIKGYEFAVSTLLPAKPSESLAALVHRVHNALPAPQPEAEPEAPKAEEKNAKAGGKK